MPAQGIAFAPIKQLLTLEEIKRLTQVLVFLGIDKIRLTGGEPFVRQEMDELLPFLGSLEPLKHLSITTNGTLIENKITAMTNAGVDSVNVSLDAIRSVTFEKITRRNDFDRVLSNIHRLLETTMKISLNFIVLEGQNEHEIIPLIEYFKSYKIAIRFLEEMPFNGGVKSFEALRWNHHRILNFIRSHYPELVGLRQEPTATATLYQIPGYQNTVGIIPSFSRTFCGSCNRLRVTAKGDLVTCLYGKPKANLKNLMRQHEDDEALIEAIKYAVGARAKTGFEAQKEFENDVFSQSMTSIGG